MVLAERAALSPGDMESRWTTFLEEADLRGRVLEVAERYPELRSLEVPFNLIDRHNSELADAFLERPEMALRAAQEAIRQMIPEALSPSGPIRLRVTGLPHSRRTPIRLLRESHINRFLAIEGIVRRASEVRPQVVDAVFECAACRIHIHWPQEEGSLLFREPLECDKEQGGCGKPAGRTRFTLLPNESVYIDSQRLEIQENPESLKGGAHPEALPVVLTEDLVGQIVPGNRLVVNGTLKSVQRMTASRGGTTRSSVFDLVLLADSVEREDREYTDIPITDEDRRAIESLRGQSGLVERIVDSLAPSIRGMRTEKEAIALQLFGGIPKEQPDGVHIRGDIHVLLVGDPGVAKSQLLRWVASIAPRGVYTSGKGATAAGLTAAAVKDDFAGGRWTLEAGAMVLADGGSLMVDELDKMSPEDRSSMHEALESGTVSISKAGITATLRARCPVLAAANPKLGRFTSDKLPAEQIDLPPTLLSRFDVIFAILDRPDQDRDRSLAGEILTQHVEAEEREAIRASGMSPRRETYLPPFSPDFLRKYIAYAKQNIFPVMEATAHQKILDFFVSLRRQGEGEHKPVPITLRQVEGLVRLTEASARARLSPVASEEDADRAIRVMEHFLRTVVASEGNRLDIDVITVGVSSNKRDQISTLRQIMRQLEESTPEGFTPREVVEAAERQGMSRDRAQKLLDEMQRLNDIYSPRPGVLRLME